MPASLAEIASQFEQRDTEIRSALERSSETDQIVAARLQHLEQKAARRPGPGASADDSMGSLVVESDAYKSFIGTMGKRGAVRIAIPFTRAITTDVGSAGGLITPDRQSDVTLLPRRRLTVRGLLAAGRTSSGSVEYTRESGFTNNARVVSESTEKPESNITYELLSQKVRVIAHWIRASKQAVDDAPALSSLIDGSLRYGLAMAEENELLNGDGTGEHLDGLIANSTSYAPAFTPSMPTMLDTLGLALLQSELAELPATGVVVSATDWRKMTMLKDTVGNYLLGGPSNPNPPSLWGLPVVATTAMAEDKFLVGSFGIAAQVFDREDANVVISSEDRDNFVTNRVTLLCEERLTLVIRRPEALIYGDFGLVT